MSEDYIKYEDTNSKSYTELKQMAANALTTTGAAFVWSYVVAQDDVITASQMQEIVNAVDVAYDALNLGCTTHYSGRQSSNYGYGAQNSSVNTSYLNSVNTTVQSSQHTSNLTAQNAAKNVTVNRTNYFVVYSSN